MTFWDGDVQYTSNIQEMFSSYLSRITTYILTFVGDMSYIHILVKFEMFCSNSLEHDAERMKPIREDSSSSA